MNCPCGDKMHKDFIYIPEEHGHRLTWICSKCGSICKIEHQCKGTGTIKEKSDKTDIFEILNKAHRHEQEKSDERKE